MEEPMTAVLPGLTACLVLPCRDSITDCPRLIPVVFVTSDFYLIAGLEKFLKNMRMYGNIRETIASKDKFAFGRRINAPYSKGKIGDMHSYR